MAGYRAAGGSAPARAVDPSQLSSATVRRLEEAVRGSCLLPSLRPSLLLPREAIALLAIAGLALSVAALSPRYGRPEPPRLSRSARASLLGLGLAALGAAAALGARRARLGRKLPVEPGVYLLARDLLDARRPPLVVRPLTGLREIKDARGPLNERSVRLTFDDGASFLFPSGITQDDRLRAQIADLAEQIERAETEGDSETLDRLDPLHRQRGRLLGSHAPPPPVDRGLAPSWPVPVVSIVLPIAAAALAPSIIKARDLASEQAEFEEALASGDDDELRRFSDEGGRFAELADEDRRGRALSGRKLQELTRYLQTGGRHPEPVDEALREVCVADGSVASLEHYLRVGRAHRDEVFELLLRRGVEQHDVAALRAYERERGPRLDEVTRGLLPRAELLSAGPEETPANQLRQAVLYSSHPLHQEAARELLRARIDARLARLGPAVEGTFDLRALLSAVRDHDGRASLLVEPSSRRPDPRLVDVEKALPRLTRGALEYLVDKALEPGLVRLEEAVEGLPALAVSYELGAVPPWKPPGLGVVPRWSTEELEGDVPLKLTVALAAPGAARRLAWASTVSVRVDRAEGVFAVMRCPPELRHVGCHILRPLQVLEPRHLDVPDARFFRP